MIRVLLVPLVMVWSLMACGQPQRGLELPEEKHLRNVTQLTFGGENAEAYFSSDDQRLILQRTYGAVECDQIFTMNIDGSDLQMVSTGKGRTTCSYFFPNDMRILYSSTHHVDEQCPPPPDYSKGYVWALYGGFDIFTAKPDGSDLQQLTDSPGYDAEATICHKTGKIIFTSMRNGDLDLYSMNLDGSDVKQLTDRKGYDGGAFYSLDGTKIVWRAYYPETEEEIKDYDQLLSDEMIRPMALQIRVMDADGSNVRQVTDNTAANFGPFFNPDGQRIIFASNMDSPRGRNFDLYMINVDGTGLERITYDDQFDGFPMFTADGKKLVFASNRHGAKKGDTNIFICDWVD